MSKSVFHFFCVLFCLATSPNFGISQQAIAKSKIFSQKQIVAASDVEGALYADRIRKIRLSSTPKGSGKKIEVASSKAKDLFYFEKEHNIVWIKFRAPKTGGLAFTIVPDSTKDDYDFLLFKSEGRNTVSKIENKEIRPIRSNIARTKNINLGITGLRLNEESTHNSSGVNKGFSQTVDVIEGEMLFLAIDNVYENGGGATIDFEYFEQTTIEGVVVNSAKQPVEAKVVWEDAETGEELSVTHSTPEDGSFKITVPYEPERSNNYTLSIFSDDCLFEEITYIPVEVETKSAEKLSVVLPKLKKGLKTPLHSINFEGGKSTLLKSAYPSLGRLTKLMKRNKQLEILIVGHTNGCSGGANFTQVLSESRADITREYLISKGINGDRIKTEGKNCEEMLYSTHSSKQQQALNRRIEVSVTSY